MDVQCPECHALHFDCEKLSKSTCAQKCFGICCLEGKVQLPALPQWPQELQRLYENNWYFVHNVCQYNNTFAFTSLGVEMDLHTVCTRSWSSSILHTWRTITWWAVYCLGKMRFQALHSVTSMIPMKQWQFIRNIMEISMQMFYESWMTCCLTIIHMFKCSSMLIRYWMQDLKQIKVIFMYSYITMKQLMPEDITYQLPMKLQQSFLEMVQKFWMKIVISSYALKKVVYDTLATFIMHIPHCTMFCYFQKVNMLASWHKTATKWG